MSVFLAGLCLEQQLMEFPAGFEHRNLLHAQVSLGTHCCPLVLLHPWIITCWSLGKSFCPPWLCSVPHLSSHTATPGADAPGKFSCRRHSPHRQGFLAGEDTTASKSLPLSSILSRSSFIPRFYKTAGLDGLGAA